MCDKCDEIILRLTRTNSKEAHDTIACQAIRNYAKIYERFRPLLEECKTFGLTSDQMPSPTYVAALLIEVVTYVKDDEYGNRLKRLAKCIVDEVNEKRPLIH